MTIFPIFPNCRDSIVVSTLRCGRNNPGSNPGHGMPLYLPQFFRQHIFIIISTITKTFMSGWPSGLRRQAEWKLSVLVLE